MHHQVQSADYGKRCPITAGFVFIAIINLIVQKLMAFPTLNGLAE